MSERSTVHPSTQPTGGPPTSGPPAVGQPAGPPVPRQRLRDRLFGFRSLVAVALAGVILGGGAGAGLMAIADGGNGGRAFPGGSRGHVPGGERGQFGPGNGQWQDPRQGSLPGGEDGSDGSSQGS